MTSVTSTAESITLKIDGKDISCRSGETILQVARENNIDIPTLCFLEGLTVWGGCRLCMVEIAQSYDIFAMSADDPGLMQILFTADGAFHER